MTQEVGNLSATVGLLDGVGEVYEAVGLAQRTRVGAGVAPHPHRGAVTTARNVRLDDAPACARRPHDVAPDG